VDFVATDTHDIARRHPNMTQAYATLKELVGQEYADELMFENQRRLLLGE